VEAVVALVESWLRSGAEWTDRKGIRHALLLENAERRCPEDRTLSVGAAFLQERAHLMALPENGFPTGKTPYVRFDGNDYSIPHTHVRRTLVVVAGPQMVCVFDGNHPVSPSTCPMTLASANSSSAPPTSAAMTN
jgi:hypothetical protein